MTANVLSHRGPYFVIMCECGCRGWWHVDVWLLFFVTAVTVRHEAAQKPGTHVRLILLNIFDSPSDVCECVCGRKLWDTP